MLLWLGVALVCLGAVGIGAGLGAYYWISQDLPRIERLADYRPPAVTQIFSADGRLMMEYFHQRRYVVPMSRIPKVVVWAFVSAEDGEFFHHKGIDFMGILRAAWANFKAGHVVQGGSTITQQVARGLLLTPRQTMIRKIKEAILARRIEQYLTKDEILYLYLNQIYLGHGAYGVQAAALTYFGKDVSQLDVAEAAFLAGLVKAPSRYSPVRHYRRARARQEYVIGRMLADGHITSQQAEEALTRQLDIKLTRPRMVKAAYYTEYVRQWLEERFGKQTLYEGGLTVQTACDPELTAAGRAAIKRGLEALTRRHAWRGPLERVSAEALRAARQRPVSEGGLEAGQVVRGIVTLLEPGEVGAQVRMGAALGLLEAEDLKWAHRRGGPGLKPGDVVQVRLLARGGKPGVWRVQLYQEPKAQAALLAMEAHTGRVRVLIGGSDFRKSQYNRAIQARRQPGSAFKPFIYAAALDHPVQGWTPASVIVDAPVIYDDPGQPGAKWKPKNYENRFYGPTTLRTALEHSRNVVTVKLLARLGLDYTLNYARRFGFTSKLAPNLSLALGTSGMSLLELTRAYSVFDNQGELVEPVFIEKVLDRTGKVIYRAAPSKRQVISPQTAFLMTHLLRGVVEHGTGRLMLRLKRPVAGKTGTTNDLRDAWFIGFTPQLVAGVWVGRDDNKPLGRRETGARAAGPIWLGFMQEAVKELPPEDFPVPPGVVFTRIDPQTGRAMPPGAAGGFFEAFKQGTEPPPGDQAPAAQPEKAEEFLQAESFADDEQANSEQPPTPQEQPGEPAGQAPAPPAPGLQGGGEEVH